MLLKSIAFFATVIAGQSVCEGIAPPDIFSWEPLESEYWASVGKNGTEGRPYQLAEFKASSLSRAAFDKLVREGRAFIVRGVGMSHPMRGWDCDFFRKDTTFSKVEAREEYGSAGSVWLRLGKLRGNQSLRCEPGDGSGKHTSPFYLGIKDIGYNRHEEPENPTWTNAVLEKVRKHTIVPAFMDPRNDRHFRSTPELWFSSGGCGGGAKAHVDQHQESTMSLQLAGRKRWRVSFIAPRAVPHVMRLYADGQIYGREEHRYWNMFTDAILEEGDAIFFGPGFIHQTDAAAECTASITWQFHEPKPTTLWRRFLPRIRWTADLHSTWEFLWDLFDKETRSGGTLRGSTAQALLDMDGDGQVTEEERQRVVGLWEELEAHARKSFPSALQRGEFGIERIIQDKEELQHFPKKIRKAVQLWEKYALAQDEALAGAERGSSGGDVAVSSRGQLPPIADKHGSMAGSEL